jgi:hypothetical protein
MPSIGSARHLRFALAAVLATAAASLVGCGATTPREDLGEVELRQDNEPAPTCNDKFECDCEAIGGTVDGPDWCCKHYADGSSICTNLPDHIISWLETPPGPKRPLHVQDIPGIELEMSGPKSEPIEPDPKDPAFASVCESLQKQADANKGELLEFDPNMSGFPGSSEKERFDSAACHGFCNLVVRGCDFIGCGATDYACQINCERIGMNCDFTCVDLLIASEYPR